MSTTTPTPKTIRSANADSVSTASRHQQLRSHLAELKLHAAAEAWPAVLDEATAERQSLTVALERLLAVEVDASTARRLAGRLRFACLPTPATLEDFDVDAAVGIDRALIDELGTCRYLKSATNILLIGPPGTRLACLLNSAGPCKRLPELVLPCPVRLGSPRSEPAWLPRTQQSQWTRVFTGCERCGEVLRAIVSDRLR